MRGTICVDFDGVLHSYTTKWVDAETIPDPPVEGALLWLDFVAGHYDVVILTTRAETPEGQRAVRHWLHENGVAWGMNANVTNVKVPALLYLDDRAYRFNGPGGFPDLRAIEEAIPWNKR